MIVAVGLTTENEEYGDAAVNGGDGADLVEGTRAAENRLLEETQPVP